MEGYIKDIFGSVLDPRVEGRCLHKLSDILFIALCTVLSNGEDCMDMVTFAEQRKDWLKKILDLPNGIPSDDTFRRVLQIVDSEALSSILVDHGDEFIDRYKGELINLDGKKMKGVSPRSRGNKGLYILSAWASSQGICIGQKKVDDKSNEITAIPELLEELNITGSIVSIDAIGCQVEIAKKIKQKSADYLLSVKLNQKELHEEITESFGFAPISDYSEDWEYDHGRYETRTCSILPAKEVLSPNIIGKWPSAETLIRVKSTRTIGEATTSKTRYYISSLGTKTAQNYNAMVRKHWSIENELHWHLDVTFKEDDCRIRKGNAPQNMNILRKKALSMVKKMKDKSSLQKRRFKCSLNTEYLTKMLTC